MYSGSCLCGSVTYQINAELGDFGYCHCRSCQKASGTSYGANVGVRRSELVLSDPQQLVRAFESSPGKCRAFCANCGSPLYAYLTNNNEFVRIRLGSLDTPFEQRAKAHTFASEKAGWEVIDDGLPQYDAWADPAVLVQLGSKQQSG